MKKAIVETAPITFTATLFRPKGFGEVDWHFLLLPPGASDPLPSRGMVSVEGTFQGAELRVTLEPDGNGGHWMRVKRPLREAAGVSAGDLVTVTMSPAKVEPEPEVPDDFQAALDTSAKAQETWASITAAARRDWVFWISSGKKAETRIKRIEVAMSKMSAGNRRPCCFDRSGMYDKSLSAPEPDLD